MRTVERKVLFACCVLLLLLGSGAAVPAFAEEYDVAFGVETKRGQDFGSVTCSFDEVCSARMDALGLRLTVHVIRGNSGRAYVHLYGEDISCCYFAEAADFVTVDRQKSLSPLPFFSGRSARGGLYIGNKYAGTLYLKFRSH